MKIAFDDERERRAIQRALNDLLRARSAMEAGIARRRSWRPSERAMAIADVQVTNEALRSLLTACAPTEQGEQT